MALTIPFKMSLNSLANTISSYDNTNKQFRQHISNKSINGSVCYIYTIVQEGTKIWHISDMLCSFVYYGNMVTFNSMSYT